MSRSVNTFHAEAHKEVHTIHRWRTVRRRCAVNLPAVGSLAAPRTITFLSFLACPNFRDPEIAVAKNTHTPRHQAGTLATDPTVYPPHSPQPHELLKELPGKGVSRTRIIPDFWKLHIEILNYLRILKLNAHLLCLHCKKGVKWTHNAEVMCVSLEPLQLNHFRNSKFRRCAVLHLYL